MADLRPDLAAYTLAEPDFEWQDFADDYLTDVLDAVVRWGDGDCAARRLRDFDSWLAATRRRTRHPVWRRKDATVRHALSARPDQAPARSAPKQLGAQPPAVHSVRSA